MTEQKAEMESIPSETLVRYIKRFNLTIDDLVSESGRSKYTLYGWWKRDKKLIACIIKSALRTKVDSHFDVLDELEELVEG